MADSCKVEMVENRESWDLLVAGAAGGTVFSTWAWMTALAGAERAVFAPYGFFRNGNLVAGCAVLQRRKACLATASTPILTPYTGLLYSRCPARSDSKTESEQAQAAPQLIERLERDASRAVLANSPDIVDTRWFQWRGWSVKVNYTYRIDIRDPDQVWSRFEGRTRKAIRKAERDGFVVEAREQMGRFGELYRKVYQRRGISPSISEKRLLRCVAAAQETGLLRHYCVMSPAGDIASAVIYVVAPEAIYAWVAGADPAYNDSGAASLLHWKVIQEMSAGCPVFDFLGANRPSIAKFKRGFGGELVPYYVTEHFAPGSHGFVARVAGKLAAVLAAARR